MTCPTRLILALAALLIPACDAPEKSVGQETEGTSGGAEGSASGSSASTMSGSSATSGSASATSGPPTATSGPPTATSGPPTATSGPPTATSGSESGDTEPLDCSSLDESSCLEDEGCLWGTIDTVDADSASCELNDGGGYCYDSPNDPGCDQGPTCSEDGREYYYRSTAEGTWDVIPITGCPQPVPADFSPCQFDGTDPAACDCACGSGGQAILPPGWDDELSASGCADMAAYAQNPDDTIGFALFLDEGIVEAAADSQMSFEGTFDVSEFERFVVLVGTNVTNPECNDAVAPGETVIDQEWVATSGSVHVIIDPVPAAPPFGVSGHATITFMGVEVSYEGSTESIANMTFEDIAVGWLPG